MLLSELIAGAPPVEVSSLAYDSRSVAPGGAFFCVRGQRRDGHELAGEAVRAGAAALVVDHELDLPVPQVVVPDVRASMAPAAAAFHGDPTARLAVAGVTGTNGKTTTAYLLRALLQGGGVDCGLLGTVEAIVGGAREPVRHTTPEAIDLQASFARMVLAGDSAVAMEVSSHALQLHRADAIHWDVAIFTNLTRDHLDFHSDMESYFASKRRLFEAAPRHAVVNVDDPYGERLAADQAGVTTFGIERGRLRATELDERRDATSFTVDGMRLTVPLPGRFNVLNALGAVAAARLLGIADAVIERELPRARTAPGRFEPVDAGQDFAVIVDYAHTPDSLGNVLRAARAMTSGRVIAVFGAGGDRDREKRPLMGAAAATESDLVIVTSDNPRSEEPEAIIADVVAGIGAGVALEQLPDRRAAIFRAIEVAQAGDVVVIAGKGHERGQELSEGRIVPFDDAAVAREGLGARLER